MRVKIGEECSTFNMTRVKHMNIMDIYVLQENYTENSPSMGLGGSALSSVPSTLTRWSEAAKVLDGDSMHDCMAGRYHCFKSCTSCLWEVWLKRSL